MNSRLCVRALFLALVAALSLVACSDDDNPTDTDTDTTPPGVSSVTAVDATHIDVTFSEAVTRASAEDTGNYFIVTAPVLAPARGLAAGGGLSVLAASLGTNGRTVTLSTNPMLGIDYRLSLQNISDTHGNTISQQVDKDFPGSIDADNTPPTLVYRKPASGATNVPIGEVIALTFSEPIQQNTLEAGFDMTGPGAVVVTFTSTDQTHFTGTHDPLQKNYTYNLSLGDVLDLSNNAMALPENWTFKTTNADDNTPPTLVSSSPSNLATYVNVNATLSLTFSEPIDQNSFSPNFTPEITGLYDWSSDGKTIEFSPDGPLAADTQYELEIFPGDVQDLAGNPNTVLYTRVFTTGAALEAGSIAGIIMGDANSTAAGDPKGAYVAAATAFPFGGSPFTVYGATTVAANHTYTVRYLRDDTYFPMCLMDTVHDELLDPFFGDAIGFYGIDLVVGDMTPDSVIVAGGIDLVGINFKLYDPTAVFGQVDYKGVYGAEPHAIFVGLFETAGFDPNTSTPVAGAEASWPELPFYLINSIEVGPIANGSYYIGGFLDVNDNGDYDAGVDPAGFFGGTPPTAVNLSNGSDRANANFLLLDPATSANATVTHWVATPHAKWLQNLSEALKDADLTPLK